MADEQDTTAPAHAPAIHGKGKGILNGPHREMIIVVCSVVGVGLTFALLRRTGSSTAPTASTSTLSGAGTLTGGQVAGFDQNAMAGLQTMISGLSSQMSALEATATSAPLTASTPAPLAAQLTAPTFSGTYVGYGSIDAGNNSINEVESDGSLYHLSMPEWLRVLSANPQAAPAASYAGAAPTNYNGSANLQSKINTAAGVSSASTP